MGVKHPMLIKEVDQIQEGACNDREGGTWSKYSLTRGTHYLPPAIRPCRKVDSVLLKERNVDNLQNFSVSEG
jgi:hypothetical protein